MRVSEKLQKLFKWGKLLSTAAFILFVIATVLSGVGLICLHFDWNGILKFGGISASDVSKGRAYLCVLLAVYLGEAVNAYFAVNYFKNEVEAGTPYTDKGSKELFRLGLITVVVPLVAFVIASLAAGLVLEFGSVADQDYKALSVVQEKILLGLAFMVVALFCQNGAEQGNDTED